MTSRDEQRRKRRSDSFRRDEADEADNWLAGLRGGGRGNEPDPFAAPPPEPPPFDHPSFDRPGPLERSGSFDRPGPADRSGSFDRPGPLERSGSFERPGPLERSGSFGRPALDPPAAFDGPAAPSGPPGPGSGVPGAPGGPGGPGGPAGRRSGGRRSRADDSPSGIFSPSALPPAPPPARPALDARMSPDATQIGGRRRARDDDSPSGTFGRAALPPARPALDQQPPAGPPESRGRRRARDDDRPERGPSESYGHGPQLEPIIKPLAELTAPKVTAEPPPLVPIFPTLRPDTSPTSGASPTGRRARRAADDEAAGYTGEVSGGRRRDRAADDTGARRQRGVTEDAPGTRTGELGGGRRRALPDDGAFRTGNGYDAGRPGRPGRPDFADDINGGNGINGGGRSGFAARPDETTAFRRGEDSGVRRQRPGVGDQVGNTRAGETGIPRRDRGGYDGEGPDGFRRDVAVPRGRDDTGTGRRPRGGFEPGLEAAFEAGAPATEIGVPRRRDDSGVRRRDDTVRRHPALDDAPQQRRALDDAMPPRGRDGGLDHDDPSVVRRRGAGQRGTGEYTGDYTTGGTRRALREPPGGRPAGDRAERPGRPGRGGTGTHPRAVIDTVRPEHRPHRWVAMLSFIAVVLVLGACAIGTWFIFKDERNGPESARSSATAGPKKRDISSRQVDPNPLTEAEVFPSNNIVAVPNEPPYVILTTKASPDCKVAATEELATLLMTAGCSEVVRATMKSPNEEYLITAGIFNLTSEETAQKAFDGVKGIVDGQKGRFAGMSVGAGTGTDALVRAPTQLGWNFRGHFIAYCVIARVDGNPFAVDDPYPNQITYDIVETYLENGIIEGRAIIQPEATPAASLPVAPSSPPAG